MSPERLRGEPYGPAADVWSLGLLLVTMARGSFPLPTGYWQLLHALDTTGAPALRGPAVSRETIVGAGRDRSDDGEHMPSSYVFSAAAADFTARCLSLVAAERPSADELLRHPWLREYAMRGGGIPPPPPPPFPPPAVLLEELDDVLLTVLRHADAEAESATAAAKEEEEEEGWQGGAPRAERGAPSMKGSAGRLGMGGIWAVAG